MVLKINSSGCCPEHSAINPSTSVLQPGMTTGVPPKPVTLNELIKQMKDTERTVVGNNHQPSLTQEKQHAKKTSLMSGSILSAIAEAGVLADAMLGLGQNGKARKYINNGLNALLKREVPGPVPDELLRKWQAPNTEAMFVRMWLKSCIFSSYITRKKSKEILLFWIEHENNCSEAYLKFGLLTACLNHMKDKPASKQAMDSLLKACELMNNERSETALMIAERGIANQLRVPYDGGHIWVYPDIRNLTTYILLEQGDWFEDDIHLFRALVRPGDRVLDLGANVGVFSMSGARRAGRQGRIVSVEPCDQTFSLLQKSAGAFGNINCINAAVSETSGRGTLDLSRGPEFIELQTDPSMAKGESVDIVSVDDIAEALGIDNFDLIKIDVEGHEIPTLKGAKKIISQGNPIIFYEIKEGSGKMNIGLVEVFRQLGYDSYYFCEPRSSIVKYQKEHPLDPFTINMIAVRPESLSRFEGIINVE